MKPTSSLTFNQGQLLYWMIERETIRQFKEAGYPRSQWTKDAVMRETYFCNVDREDDKVTRWIRTNWGMKSEYYYPMSMIVARIFNLPSTLEVIEQPDLFMKKFSEEGTLNRSHSILLTKYENKEPIWNGAYIISTAGAKMSKLEYCFNLFKGAIPILDELSMSDSLDSAHKVLMKVKGLASFLAAQVVADLKNTEYHSLQFANDWFHFSAPGPGSLRGLSWFWEKEVKSSEYDEAVSTAWKLIKLHLPSNILKKICMQNFQNCLCEYDKFMRVSTNTGRSKRKYPSCK